MNFLFTVLGFIAGVCVTLFIIAFFYGSSRNTRDEID